MAGNIAEVVLRVKADTAQVPQVVRSLQDVEQEAQQAAAAMEGLEDGAGKVGQSAAKMAGALDLAAPGLGQVALAVADFADVGEVAASVATALGVSMGTLAAVAAPIAVVVAGIALAWSSYSASAKEAEEAQKRLNAALDKVDPIAGRARDEIDKLKLNFGQLTQAQYDDNEIRKDFEAQLEAGTAGLREEQAAIEAQMTAIGTWNAEYAQLQDRLHEVNGLIDTATTLNQQGQDAALANAEIARERAESEKVLADRLRAKAEAERRAAAAAREHTGALKEQAVVAPTIIGWEAMAEDRLQFWADSAAALEEAGDRREAALLADIENTRAWAEAQAEAAEKAKKAAEDYQNAMVGNITSATSTFSAIGGALSSSSISGLIAAIGPALGAAIAGPIGEAIGSAVGAWFGFLENLGSKGIDEIKAGFEQSAQNIIEGMKLLPELIAEVMPEVLRDFLPAYLQAQTLANMRMVVQLVHGMVDAIRNVFHAITHPLGQEERAQRREDRREQRRDNLDSLMKYLWTGEFATGTDYVPRTGLALVHQGEKIEPARGGSMGARMAAGGGDVHLHLSGFAVGTPDQLIRELNRHLGASNRRLSWST